MQTLAPLFFVLLTLVTGCAMETAPAITRDPAAPDALAPTPDAGMPDPGSDSAPPTDPIRPDAGVIEGGQEGGATPTPDAGPATPDAVPPSQDGGPDAVATPDAGWSDGGADTGPDATGPDVAPDMQPTADAGDAGATSDADSGAGVDPVCTSPLPECGQALAADQAIRDQFTKPCSPEAFRQCGGVYRGVVETLPMVCRDGRWRLAGSWSGVQWVPLYMCSRGCGAAGKLCDP